MEREQNDAVDGSVSPERAAGADAAGFVAASATSERRLAPPPAGIGDIREGAYVVRFARDEADLDRVLRLRFEVFNRELGEGLATSWETGRDEDRFDRVCHHLMLEHRSGELVGTYRIQTTRMARTSGEGFYCDQEFDLSSLGEDVLGSAVETGRAAIIDRHRNGTALFCLWRGLAAYLTWSRAHLLFGCCSLTSQDPADGVSMLRHLEATGRVSELHRVVPREGFECETSVEALPDVRMPKLFGTYLRYGGAVCGPPAIDRDFGTIDFFLMLDSDLVHPRLRAMFFAGLPVEGFER